MNNDIVNFSTKTVPLAISEADHRITNNLAIISSLIRLKAKHPNVDDVRQFLIDVACRVDTVARLHRLLAYAQGGSVPMAQFLRSVGEAMRDIGGGNGRLHMTIECPEALTLPPDRALRIGLLTAELFSNSVKYAPPTGIPSCIQVGCRQDHDVLVFSFEDDGIGFPENFDPHRNDSLGMQILHSLSADMHGACEWHDTGIGLRFTCRFPLVRTPDPVAS